MEKVGSIKWRRWVSFGGYALGIIECSSLVLMSGKSGNPWEVDGGNCDEEGRNHHIEKVMGFIG